METELLSAENWFVDCFKPDKGDRAGTFRIDPKVLNQPRQTDNNILDKGICNRHMSETDRKIAACSEN